MNIFANKYHFVSLISVCFDFYYISIYSKLYCFHNSDLTFLNTFINSSMLGLKSSLI